MRRAYFVCYLLLLISSNAFADQLIIEPNMGRQPLLSAIHQAHTSIELVMYGFTDEQLINALIRQHARGCIVKIILEGKPYRAESENTKALRKLRAAHIPVKTKIKLMQLIHQKTLIIDHHKAYIMTFNFTHSTFKRMRNFAVMVNDPTRVNQIMLMFDADWQQRATHNTLPDLLYSPDNSRAGLINLIQHAQQSIDIYAQNYNDYQLMRVLKQSAQNGVHIRILSAAKPKQKLAAYLQQAGIQLKESKQYYIHAKVFLIDNKEVVAGSINLTKNALDHNRELSIVSHDSTVVNVLKNIFAQDWQHAQSTPLYFKRKLFLHAAKLINHYFNIYLSHHQNDAYL